MLIRGIAAREKPEPTEMPGVEGLLSQGVPKNGHQAGKGETEAGKEMQTENLG